MNEAEKRRRAENEEGVLEVLQIANGHPLHSEQIAWKKNILAGEVNDAVLSLRSRGIPICGDDAVDGYYYGCPALLKRTITTLKWQRQLLDLAIELLERRLEDDGGVRESDS